MIERIAFPSGRLHVRVFRRCLLVDEWARDNLVVTGAAFANSRNAGGTTSGNAITRIGFGTNPNAPAYANSSLSVDAFTKAVGSITFPTQNELAVAFTLASGEANGLAIAEYGLLLGSGALYARLTRSAPLVKDVTMSLSAVWTISF
jgi:hypothetical protein